MTELRSIRAALADRWRGLRPLEKVGVVAVGACLVGGASVLLAPGFAATTIGGALLGAGGWLVNRGMRR